MIAERQIVFPMILQSIVHLQVTPKRQGPVRLIVPFPPDGTIDESVYYDSWHYATIPTLDELHETMDKHFDNICRYGMVPLVCSVSNSSGSSILMNEFGHLMEGE